MMESLLKYFPKDLQLSTWRYLSPIELCCVSQVCKSFNQTSSLDELWVHFVKVPKEITKDYKNYFLQKMRQSWKKPKDLQLPKEAPFFLIDKLFDEKRCLTAKDYQTRFPLLIPQEIKSAKSKASDQSSISLKIVLAGDPNVGKTPLIERYLENTFTNSFTGSIGIDFRIKTIEIGGRVIKLQIWDTAGQERFRTITSSYYRGAHGIFIVGDTTDPKSLEDMKKVWAPEIERCASPDVSILYCLNKSDLKELSPEEVEKYIPKNEKWIQTSAKTGENVDEMFERMAKMILNRVTGLRPEICWDENWSLESLHTVIPNLDSYLEKLENFQNQLSPVQGNNYSELKKNSSMCQIQ